jgi:hypothetical protein
MSLALAGQNGTVLATNVDQYAPEIPRGHHFSLSDLWTMAHAVAASGLFSGIKSQASAYSLMLLCEAEGIHPIQAVRRYHIFDGKVSMRADAMQADFQANGGKIAWHQTTKAIAEATFSHAKHNPEGFRLSVQIEDFKHLCSKDNWKNNPAAMLRARLVTQGVKMIDPAVVVGLYTQDELEEVRGYESSQSSGPTFDVTPKAAPVVQRAAPDDVPVLGQSELGNDPRAYIAVAKAAVREANAKITALTQGTELNLPALTDGLVHKAVMKAAASAGHMPPPEGTLKASEVIKLIVENLYPVHRAFVRETIQSALLGQLDEVTKALEPAGEPVPAENVSQDSDDAIDDLLDAEEDEGRQAGEDG